MDEIQRREGEMRSSERSRREEVAISRINIIQGNVTTVEKRKR